VARAEDTLIQYYNPDWNGIPGFSLHVPGIGRPERPGYVNEWDDPEAAIRLRTGGPVLAVVT
jgi:hypothetical protein